MAADYKDPGCWQIIRIIPEPKHVCGYCKTNKKLLRVGKPGGDKSGDQFTMCVDCFMKYQKQRIPRMLLERKLEYERTTRRWKKS